MPHRRSQLGTWGEHVALRSLRQRGFVLLARNVRTRYGELDLVLLDGNTLVAVEVKTRRSLRYGVPQESITQKKFTHLADATAAFVQRIRWQGPYRLDAVSVVVRGKQARVLHLRNIGG